MILSKFPRTFPTGFPRMSPSQFLGRFVALIALLCTLLSIGAMAEDASDGEYDFLLRGGEVHDGSGGPPRAVDVAISGERIAAIGDLAGTRAKQILELDGLVLAPGFIDIHSHAVRDRADRSGLLLWPDAENYLRQGVTTAIGGPDGGSWYPISGLLERVEAAPATINFGTFVGHNRIRTLAMGREDRAPTEDELAAMEAMVDQAMQDGAFGLSTGLKYIPGAYAGLDEVVALSRVAARHGGIYITHMREEGLGLLDSVRETIAIGEAAGIPVQVTHHKVMGVSMWGKSRESLALIDAARARGLDVSSDQYPYAASSTGISVLFPAWSQAGDRETRLARMSDPEVRPKILAGIVRNLREDRGGNDLTRVAIAQCTWDPSLNGLTLADLVERQGGPPTLEAAAEIVLWLEVQGGCSGVYHAMSEEDVDRIMLHPATMIASDGGIFVPGDNVPHPRNYGAFARVLEVYVRERGLLDLPTAIHKMSQMPADRLGLGNRGRIAVGAFADLTVLDPDQVRSPATFKAPHQYALGVQHVFVNGQPAMVDGVLTGRRDGRVLRITD